MQPSSSSTPPAPASRPSAGSALFDLSKLREFIFILRERWMLGLALGLFVGGLFIFWRIQEIPTYRAAGILSVELDTDKVIDIERVDESSLRGPLEAELNQHMRQLGSQTFLERVVASLSRREEDRVLAPYRVAGERPPTVLGVVGQALDLRYLSNSRMVEVGIIHRDAEAAALLANRIIDEYPRYLLDRTSVSTHSAIAYLEEQAASLQDKVQASEAALQAYRQEHQLVSLEENQNIIVGRLNSLSQALTEAKVRLSEVASKTEQIETLEAAGSDLTELSFIARYGPLPEILQQIKDLEIERERLTQRYLRKHPRLIQNGRALEAVQGQKDAVIRKAVTEMRNTQAQVELEIDRLTRELNRAEADALELDRRGIEYNVLRQRLANDRQSYQQVLQRLNETNITRDLSLTNIQTVDRARVPWKPIAPDRAQILTRAAFLFALCFIGLPLGLHYLNDKVRLYSDIEVYLQQELLGDLPLLKASEIPDDPLALPEGHVTECCAAMASRIEVLGGDYRPKTLLLTSSLPQEGKTTITHHLGLTLAENGQRVLLIDFDWRRPSLGGAFGLRNDTGLLRWLADGAKVPDSLQAARDDSSLGLTQLAPKLDILPAGGHEKVPQAKLNQKALGELITLLKTGYDYLLLDTPPVGIFPDAYTLAKLADETIFVCRQNAVGHRRARHLIERLNETPAAVLGVVLNGVKRAGPDGHRGTYGYGYSYEYKAYRSYYNEPASRDTALNVER